MSTGDHLANTPGYHAPPQQFQREQDLIFHTCYLVVSHPVLAKRSEFREKNFGHALHR